MKKIIFSILLVVLILVLVVLGRVLLREKEENVISEVKYEEDKVEIKVEETPIPEVVEIPIPVIDLTELESAIPSETPVPEDKTATIVSFGDTLVHTRVYNAAYDKETDEYEFSGMFKYVEKYFKEATICIGNSESPFAGKDRGYSGYPAFNAPEHLATDLKELGVDILTTANNHCLDKGFSGLSSTLDFLDEAGITHVGTARSQEEQDSVLIKDLNGIKTAFLAFTYGTNGIKIPTGKEYCVNLIDKEFMLSQIGKAKDLGAEAIIVSMHWGVEYQTIENSNQDKLAEFLIGNDVNIILGCHPHVLQPMKMLEIETESGTKKGLVIFSQGNFFSAQNYENTRNTAIFEITIIKNGITNEVTVEKANYVPVYVYDNGSNSKDRYELLDLEEIILDYENENGTSKVELEEDETTKKSWSKSMYKLAITERDRCYKLIGPEIDNTVEK